MSEYSGIRDLCRKFLAMLRFDRYDRAEDILAEMYIWLKDHFEADAPPPLGVHVREGVGVKDEAG